MITTCTILYWQEVPSQIKAEDERDEVTVSLGAFHGAHRSVGSPARPARRGRVLSQWQWSEEKQRPGAAQDVAEAVKAELEAEADW